MNVKKQNQKLYGFKIARFKFIKTFYRVCVKSILYRVHFIHGACLTPKQKNKDTENNGFISLNIDF